MLFLKCASDKKVKPLSWEEPCHEEPWSVAPSFNTVPIAPCTSVGVEPSALKRKLAFRHVCAKTARAIFLTKLSF